MMIQETIPNDAGPCKNYIWIRPDSPTTFTHSYLQLPEEVTGLGGVDSEFPEIVSLRNGILTYRYAEEGKVKGRAITVKAEAVPSENKPMPPG